MEQVLPHLPYSFTAQKGKNSEKDKAYLEWLGYLMVPTTVTTRSGDEPLVVMMLYGLWELWTFDRVFSFLTKRFRVKRMAHS
ncbi:hypothetical protein HOLleu_34764 [Holothuria leucospilota]|uniref:Uncharacterized protein n=1 Tax=Holothuria leucospilota TaxID=206669 RepID=A0A9Q0YLK3_HOLLE|nr:hypothetical protein HOLleu_34764 [Holothuria leucospilota]